ncbi:hypothetical protein [Methylomagnum sp.]
MIHAFHPEAATEYAEQVAYYKSLRVELGNRYHAAVKMTIADLREYPLRHRVESPPDIRRAKVQGFPYNVIFREVGGRIQILAVAHYRRRPHYWRGRI